MLKDIVAGGRRTPPSTRRPELPDTRDGKSAAMGPASVLVVDDNDDLRELYVEIFRGAGYRVREAANGQEAIDSVAASKPDVIVMDLTMPVLDGWEATKEIKRREASSDVFVIAVTAHATGTALDSARRAGADAVLSKPCPPDELLAGVAALLERRK